MSFQASAREAKKAVEARDWVEADRHLSEALERSDGIRKAAELIGLMEAVAPHQPNSAYNLGLMRLDGIGCRRDAAAAAALFRPLSMSDDTDVAAVAHGILGPIVAGNFGGTPDLAKALFHHEQGGRLGHGEAAYNAAFAHHYGVGTREDPVAAERFYRMAVDLMDENAFFAASRLAFLLIATGGTAKFADARKLAEASTPVSDDSQGLLGAIGKATGPEAFARAYAFVAAAEARTRIRAEFEPMLREAIYKDASVVVHDVRAGRLIDFLSVFCGWKLEGADRLADQHCDRIAVAVDSGGTGWPVFAVGTPLYGYDPLLERTKQAIARGRDDAILVSGDLCIVAEPEDDHGLLLGAWLLRGGVWEEFALAPGGFDRVVAESGELVRDEDGYFASHRVDGIEQVHSWLRGKGGVAALRRMAAG